MRSRPAGAWNAILAAGFLLLLAFPPIAFSQGIATHVPVVLTDPAGPLDLAAQPSCPSPRPPVRVNVEAIGDGQLRVTVTAGFGTLFVVLFGPIQHAHVVIPGSSQAIAGNQEVPLPSGITSWTFVVVADPGAPAATVPLTVYDGCREQPWSTFVGGGIDALVSAIDIGDGQIAEGNTGTTILTLPVSLTLPSQQPVTVSYATTNRTASSASNVAAASGVVTFNPGETRKTIPLQIDGDFVPEGDETLTVTLSNPTNAVLRRSVATVRIVDDDVAPAASGDAYQATAGQTLSVPAGAGPPPGLLANDQPGTQSVQVVSFGGIDAGGDVTTFAAGTAATPPGGGSLLVRADGGFTYTPAPGFAGTFSFRYRARSLSGQSDATVIINVFGAPVANDDSDYLLIIPGDLHLAAPGLLSNDSVGTPPGSIVQFGGLDAGGQLGTPSASQVGSVRDLGNGGSLKVNGDGSFDFTAPSTVSGPFSFQYRLQSGIGADDATVTITVRRAPIVTTTGGATAFSEGGGPVGVDPGLAITYPGGTSLTSATVTVANLTDAGQEALSANVGATGITGAYTAPTLTLTGNATVAAYEQVLRTVTYNNASATPSAAARTIQFQVVSGAQSSNQATKSIAVAAINNAPLLTNIEGSSLTYTESTVPVAITSQILVSDADSPNLSSATVQITSGCAASEDVLAMSPNPRNGIGATYDAGTCRLNLSGGASQGNYQAALRAIHYSNTSALPSSVVRTVSFQISDGSASSNVVERMVTVVSLDNPPVAVDDTVTVAEDSGATAPAVLANDTDVDGGPMLIIQTSNPAHGTVQITGGGTGLTYKPDANYCNQPGGTADTFTYTLNGGSSATISITVTCEDDPPTAVDDIATVAENSGATAIPVLANDTDIDGGPMQILQASDPAHGTVQITGGGTGLKYKPDYHYCNQPGGTTDTFTYTLNGGSSATVRVTVTCDHDW